MLRSAGCDSIITPVHHFLQVPLVTSFERCFLSKIGLVFPDLAHLQVIKTSPDGSQQCPFRASDPMAGPGVKSAFCSSLAQYLVCFDEFLLNWLEYIFLLASTTCHLPTRSTHLCIHLSNYSAILFNAYFVPGTMLGDGDTILDKTHSVPPSQSHGLGGR